MTKEVNGGFYGTDFVTGALAWSRAAASLERLCVLHPTRLRVHVADPLVAVKLVRNTKSPGRRGEDRQPIWSDDVGGQSAFSQEELAVEKVVCSIFSGGGEMCELLGRSVS